MVPVTPPAFADRIFTKSCADMSNLPAGSIHCVVTSPPFETQRDYSADVENLGNYRGDEFIVRMRAPVREVFRVTRDDGSAFINFMPGRKDGFVSPTLSSFPMLLEESGFKIVQIMWWIKTNARPSADPRVLKNAAEPIFHVVKTRDYFVNKDAIRRPSLYAGRDQRSWKYNPLGADRGNWLCPALERLNTMSVQEVLGAVLDPEGNALPLKKTQDQASLHPAKMPDELADWLILYGSRPGDTILDPFLGSGSSACRAKALGRHYVGFETVPEYAKLAEERVALVRFGEALEGSVTRSATAAKPKVPFLATAPSSWNRSCRTCGKPFTTKKRSQVSCSSRCRYTHANRANTRVGAIRGNNGEEADVAGGGAESPAQQKDAVHMDEQTTRPASKGPGSTAV